MSITRREILKSGIVVAGGVLATPFVARESRAQAQKLTFQTFLGPNTPVTNGFQAFAAEVKSKTEGAVEIETLPVGAVVSANDTVDAVQNGILGGHYTSPPYFAGKNPAFAVLGDTLSAYPDPALRDKWFSEGGGLELARELYAQYGLFFVGSVYWPPEWIPTRVPVNRLSDLKGLKIRMPEGLAGDLMQRAGVSIVTFPFSEVANALQTGVIDGADMASMSINLASGIDTAAKYAIFARHSMPTTEISFDAGVWDKISPEHQQIIMDEVTLFSEKQRDVFLAAEKEAIVEAERRGVNMIEFPEEDQARFRELTVEVWDDWAAKSQLAGRIVASHRDYMRKIGLI